MERKYSIEQFIENTQERDKGQGLFELETERLLEINLEDAILAKAGAMVAYKGHVKFERQGVLEQGIGKLFKKALTGEGTSLMYARGHGKLYLADQGKKISILELSQDSLYVNGNDILAFESNIQWDIKFMRKVAGILSGGLFHVKLEGSGLVAITSHYEPLTLKVTQNEPVFTDPNATVAWSGNLTPEFVTDISLKTFIGRSSGESVQMKFQGDGFVVVQPFEEVYMNQQNG
ncbi:hypothetical protein Q73_07760 [Bacillus coahuilensis m2-6]|uniref:AIM24 family protein n=1 Tax=Bacillus coahuilensis TaxID=408580 RepID=UPI0001850D05|nr:AIM24 family protein [Bacillus coahuilensis]KUP07990.1 hypothetical protein Q73_07760 [Bacillus coahuilensis m2-6]